MVDRSGITFAFRLNEETGASVPDITAAWLVARDVFDMAGFWAQVEALDGQVDTAVQILLWLEGRKLTERAARWLLHSRRPPFDIQATIDFLADGVLAVGSSLPKLLTGSDLTGFDERRDCVHLPGRAAGPRRAGGRHGPGVLGVRHRGRSPRGPGGPVEETAEVYFDLADRLQITRLRDRITALPRDDRWNTMARAALRDDLYSAHAALAADVLEVTGPGSPDQRLAAWVQRNDSAVRRAGADADRDLGDRPVHRGDAVRRGARGPHPGGRERPARLAAARLQEGEVGGVDVAAGQDEPPPAATPALAAPRR